MTSGMAVGRLLWATSSNRICSASTHRRMKTVSSQWMREAVEAAYRQLGLPTGWSSEQTERFLSLVTERLDAKAAQLSMDLAEDAISRWRTAHPGQDPDHQTTVGLHETALENAREAVVREELYALMAAPAQDQAETASRPSPEVSWEDRWRDIRYRTEPSEAVEDLVDRVWPQRSAMFRVKAAYLLATRAEEGRPVPTSPRHHLVPRLTALVEEELRADGYPIE
ncbi:hypothetical protein K3G64_00570 (plasmid) [Mycobacterium sp. IDR2000157661]|nr:hypothetical protein K3G64_00570 [Mycobacterium sp. IDR2000157661]